MGVSKKFLWSEREKSLAVESTADCRLGRCYDCGVCDHKIIKPRLCQEGRSCPPRPPRRRRASVWTGASAWKRPDRPAYLGHLEMMRLLERTIRAAGIELAYTQGFHPHALVKTAAALTTGVESLVETLEVSTIRSYDTGPVGRPGQRPAAAGPAPGQRKAGGAPVKN